jgi:hypothetical protein
MDPLNFTNPVSWMRTAPTWYSGDTANKKQACQNGTGRKILADDAELKAYLTITFRSFDFSLYSMKSFSRGYP